MDCVFARNECHTLQWSQGGAIAARDAVVTIAGSLFAHNVAHSTFDTGARGGAVSIAGGTAEISTSVFTGNRLTYTNMGVSYGGAVAGAQATVHLVGCVLDGNGGGGMTAGAAFGLSEGQGSATGCTFHRNGGGDYADGGAVFATDGTLALAACVITATWVGDGQDEVPAPAAAAWNAAIVATDCDVWGNGGDWTGPLAGQDGHDGNFSADPCFCDAASGDFHLCADSWCAPEHNPAHPGALVGALPVGCAACGCAATGIAEGGAPAAPRLLGAAPNPFNPAAAIRFALPAAGPARLTVHDLAGRRVATLLDGPASAGEQTVTWRGRDDAGRPCPSGAYRARLAAGGRTVECRLLLLR